MTLSLRSTHLLNITRRFVYRMALLVRISRELVWLLGVLGVRHRGIVKLWLASVRNRMIGVLLL